MSDLLQQPAIAWYCSGFFWAGIAIVAIALLILIVSPKRWRIIGQSVLGFPKWLREAYMWKRYGPKYIITNPVIESSLLNDDGATEIQYKVKFRISIKNKALPLKVRLSEAVVIIEQETEWGKNPPLYLGNFPRQPDIEMKPRDEGHWDLSVAQSLIGGNLRNPPDLSKDYKWGIRRIYVALPRSDTRELHKGSYHKPTSKLPKIA